MTRIALLLTAVLWLAGPAAATADPAIRVRVQDYTGGVGPTLKRSFAVADRILLDAGVRLVWLDCSPNLGLNMNRECWTNPGMADVFLRLVSERMAYAIGTVSECLGYALVPSRLEGSFAAVNVDQVYKTQRKDKVLFELVLGHAIAHEIGHLLLGSPGHTSNGVMQARWSPDQLQRSGAQPILFQAREIQAIQVNVRDRLAGALLGGRAAELHARVPDDAGASSTMLREAISTATKPTRTQGSR